MSRLKCSLMITLFLAGCSLPGTNTPTETPEQALPQPGPSQHELTPIQASGLIPADLANHYWVTNPSSGARLSVQVFYPEGHDMSTRLPALLLMPGGIAESDPQRAARIADRGFLVVIFDADGRGRSEGAEDFNGYLTQDGLAAVAVASLGLPGLDPDRFGLVSYSYGVTASSGALSRHPDLPIDFYIDWEGPVNRYYTTSGCINLSHGDIRWQPCEEDAWWSEREAVNFIGTIRVPYQRIQSEQDHVQPNNNHAIDIVNAAVEAGVPWVRLNAYPPNQVYDIAHPPEMLPEGQDRKLDQTVIEYTWYIIENILPTMP